MSLLLPEELATAVVAELDPATGALVLASVGHLPALLVGADLARLLDEMRGPALGLQRTSSYPEVRLGLTGDDRLLVFSDGLVELRDEDLADGLDRLRAAALACGRDPEALVEGVLTVLAPAGSDDVTLLALGLR